MNYNTREKQVLLYASVRTFDSENYNVVKPYQYNVELDSTAFSAIPSPKIELTSTGHFRVFYFIGFFCRFLLLRSSR